VIEKQASLDWLCKEVAVNNCTFFPLIFYLPGNVIDIFCLFFFFFFFFFFLSCFQFVSKRMLLEMHNFKDFAFLKLQKQHFYIFTNRLTLIFQIVHYKTVGSNENSLLV